MEVGFNVQGLKRVDGGNGVVVSRILCISATSEEVGINTGLHLLDTSLLMVKIRSFAASFCIRRLTLSCVGDGEVRAAKEKSRCSHFLVCSRMSSMVEIFDSLDNKG